MQKHLEIKYLCPTFAEQFRRTVLLDKTTKKKHKMKNLNGTTSDVRGIDVAAVEKFLGREIDGTYNFRDENDRKFNGWFMGSIPTESALKLALPYGARCIKIYPACNVKGEPEFMVRYIPRRCRNYRHAVITTRKCGFKMRTSKLMPGWIYKIAKIENY